MIDLTGKRFERYTVICIDSSKKSSNAYWICRCDCGNEKSVRGDHLRYGRIKSCGCLQNENRSILGKRNIHYMAGKNRIDITSMRFGNLVAIKQVGYESKYHNELWECKCDCGAIHVVIKGNLLRGHTTSCGCKMSDFEKEVSKILVLHNISFIKNKTFDSCVFQSGVRAKFDFYVDDKYIIECDGMQHSKVTKGIYSEEKVNLIKKYDEYKNNWCKENNIQIIRLPYYLKGQVEINDLLLPSSKYVLK